MNQGGGMGGGMGGGAGMGGMNPMMAMNPMMGMNPMMMGMADGMGMPGMGMIPGMGMGMGGMGMGPPGGMGMGPPSGGPMGGGPMGGGDGPMGDGKFYKTKICHKFMEGKCNYGPTCKYAHGEGDLRQGGPGGPSQPRPTGSGKIMTPHGPAMGGGPGMGPGPMGGGMGGGMGPGPMGGGPMGPKASAGDKGQHFRTRLCEQFVKEGQCRYGSTCTFAHGQQELRPFGAGGGGGGMPKAGPRPGMNAGNQPAGGGGAGAQKRPLDGPGGNMEQKRARMEPVVPPEQESLPQEGASMDLDALKRRFEALQQEANRFARDTGHSVAIFTVGGVFSDMEDVTDPAGDLYALDVKDKNNSPVQQGLKVTVLKYGTGGVSKQLATRGEIVKFVSARGSKAMQELHAFSREEQNQASA